jgi:peptidoglycan/LPS O-acetylase OafA/YrhL
VLVCLFMALSLFRPVAGSSEELSIYGASFAMMQNWLYQGKQIALNGSLWTIPIEVEAYIIYPILLLMWRRFGSSSALLLSLVAMLISTILFVNGFSNIKFSFLPYMTVWLAGAWIAEGYAHNRLPKWKGVYLLFMLPATLLLVSAGLIGLDSFWLIYGWGFVAFFTLLWVVGTSQERFNAKNTFIKQLASLGSISYSIYLIHVPVFKVLALIWVKNIGHKPISFIIPTVATLLTIPIAHAFYHFVEKPSHELAKQLGKV